MLEITLTANLPSVNKLKEFIKDIRKNVIQNGLDKELNRDLKQLREELLRLLDTKSQTINNENIEKEQNQKEVKYSASEEVVLKQLTGADITKYNKAKNFSDLVKSKLVVSQTYIKDHINTPDGHMVVRFKGTTGDFEADLNQLSDALSEATFLFVNSDGTNKYVVNPGINLKQYLKVFCTRDTGDTADARKRYEYLKDKKGFVEWRLTEKGIKELKNKGIDINGVLAAAAQGNLTHAATLLPNSAAGEQQNNKIEEIRTKLNDLINIRDLTGNAEIFSSIVTLVANLKLIKEQRTDTILNYRLVSSYSAYSASDWKADAEFVSFFEEFDRQVRTWIAVNQMPWFFEIVKKTSEIIKKYES